MTPICPLCGEPMDYQGVDDGGGDYGDSVCDRWVCEFCDYEEEGDCIGGDEDDYEDDELIEALPPDRDYNPPPRDMDDIPF